MLLAAALILVIGGTLLILTSVRERRKALAQRVAIVLPETPPLESAQKAADDLQTLLFRASRFANTETRELGRLLAKTHLSPEGAPALLVALRLVGAAITGAAAFWVALRLQTLRAALPVAWALALGMAAVGWFAVAWLLRRRASNRVGVIATGLPEALELLVVCVEAGLSLEDGLDRAIAELWQSRPELAEELSLTSADLKILPSRDDALAKFAERVNVPSVRSLVTTLGQTMRYGTPLAQALRVVATELRNDSLLRLEERASELPVLLTIPMMLFIMPTIFLIVGGPAALRVIDIFLR